jgi:hypothetical protein
MFEMRLFELANFLGSSRQKLDVSLGAIRGTASGRNLSQDLTPWMSLVD